MYQKRTTRDWVYLALALVGPFVIGFAIGGGTGGIIASILLAWGLVIYEIRMYRLTPAVYPNWTSGDVIYFVIVVVVFLGLVGAHVWAMGMIMVALCLAVRNYRVRRQWDAKMKVQPSTHSDQQTPSS